MFLFGNIKKFSFILKVKPFQICQWLKIIKHPDLSTCMEICLLPLILMDTWLFFNCDICFFDPFTFFRSFLWCIFFFFLTFFQYLIFRFLGFVNIFLSIFLFLVSLFLFFFFFFWFLFANIFWRFFLLFSFFRKQSIRLRMTNTTQMRFPSFSLPSFF